MRRIALMLTGNPTSGFQSHPSSWFCLIGCEKRQQPVRKLQPRPPDSWRPTLGWRPGRNQHLVRFAFGWGGGPHQRMRSSSRSDRSRPRDSLRPSPASPAPLPPATVLKNLLFRSSPFTMATRVILLYVPEKIIWLSEATVGR